MGIVYFYKDIPSRSCDVICFSEMIGSSLYFDDSHLCLMGAIQKQMSFPMACGALELSPRGATHTDQSMSGPWSWLMAATSLSTLWEKT